jgi:hypothetical protein
VAEQGGGENKVGQQVNAAANATTYPAVNVAANPAANVTANAAGNVVNVANVVGVRQQNVTGNARQNAGAQPPPVQANQSSQRQRIRDEVEIACCTNYDCEKRVLDPLDANHASKQQASGTCMIRSSYYMANTTKIMALQPTSTSS